MALSREETLQELENFYLEEVEEAKAWEKLNSQNAQEIPYPIESDSGC
jgi:hypothetical protein